MEPRPPILVIDDDPDIRWALKSILGEAGLSVVEADAGALGLDLAEQTRPAAIVLDMRMHGLSGEEVLAHLRCRHRAVPVIVLTGHACISGAVDAIRAGAFDYLTKPFDNDRVVATVARAVAQNRAEPRSKGASLRETITATMGRGPAIQSLVNQMELVANTDYSVLICGETGTGKEVVAQGLHRHGPRTDKPFVVFDCGAIVDALVDSEFFGHERGAFTGANDRRRGRFELAADGGTIFLDEIGNLCAVGQQALLRALEERVIYRVGGTTPIRLDTRVIAATNELLTDQDVTSEFRPDLFYRLSEFSIIVPPLRVRPEDIEFLARRFILQTQEALHRHSMDIHPDALDLLRGYEWPGNVRQLRNIVRRAGLLASTEVLAKHVQPFLPNRRTQISVPAQVVLPAHVPLRDLVGQRVRQVEYDAILQAMKLTAGNKAAAARQLGIDYKTFRMKLKALGEPALPQAEFEDA